VAIVLLLVAVIATAFVVYAIYRYGVIPMLRNLRNETESNYLWHHGGLQYRVSTITLLLATPLLGVGAGVMLMAGLVWQAGVAFLVSMAVLVVSNSWRWRFIRRYRAGIPLHGLSTPGAGFSISGVIRRVGSGVRDWKVIDVDRNSVGKTFIGGVNLETLGRCLTVSVRRFLLAHLESTENRYIWPGCRSS
jgi:hypothetical protein